MKKAIAALLLASILTASLSSCGDSKKTGSSDQTNSTSAGDSASTDGESAVAESTVTEDGVTPAGTFPIVEEPITLSVMVSQLAWVGDLNTNLVPKYIEEYTGIKLDMNVVPSASWLEKQNLALSTGNYPEVFLSGSFSNSDILKLGVKEKILVPMNDAIEKYGDSIKALWEQQKYLQGDMTAPDGNIYAIPSPQGGLESEYVHRKAWVNREWMEKLGISDPQTADEFADMLRAFKTQDPNGNGKNDEVPISGAIDTWAAEPQWWIMNAFVECEPYNSFCFIDESNTLQFAPITDEYRQGLEYMASLYAEGLIDPASFTQDGTQLQQLAKNPGDEILGCYTAGHLSMGVDPYSEDGRGAHWTGISIFEGIEGHRSVPVLSTERKGGGTYAITDACENVAAAVRLADWLLSEDGYMVTEGGILFCEEYPDYIRDAKEGELNIYGEQAKYYRMSKAEAEAAGVPDEESARIHSWSGTTLLNGSPAIAGLFATAQDPTVPEGYNLLLNQQFDKYCREFMSTNEQIPPVWIENEDDMEVYSSVSTPLFDFVEQAAAEFITGKRSFDAWDQYLAELDNMQFQEWFRIYSEAVANKLSQ